MKNQSVLVPGTVLREKFLEVYNITPTKLAKDIGLSQSAVRNIVINKAKISLNIAMRLAKYFGGSVQYWIELQNKYDLAELNGSAKFAAVLRKIPAAEKQAPAPKAAVKRPAGKKAAGRKPAAKKSVAQKPASTAKAGRKSGRKAK
jgi:addiction module HigA family antidote